MTWIPGQHSVIGKPISIIHEHEAYYLCSLINPNIYHKDSLDECLQESIKLVKNKVRIINEENVKRKLLGLYIKRYEYII